MDWAALMGHRREGALACRQTDWAALMGHRRGLRLLLVDVTARREQAGANNQMSDRPATHRPTLRTGGPLRSALLQLAIRHRCEIALIEAPDRGSTLYCSQA